jgi:hypothetical protein
VEVRAAGTTPGGIDATVHQVQTLDAETIDIITVTTSSPNPTQLIDDLLAGTRLSGHA